MCIQQDSHLFLALTSPFAFTHELCALCKAYQRLIDVQQLCELMSWQMFPPPLEYSEVGLFQRTRASERLKTLWIDLTA